MGSPFNLILVATDSMTASQMAAQSFALVDSLSHLFSDYDSSSELSYISDHAADAPVKLSPALWDILSRSKQAYENSRHSFDISVGALSRVWRKSRRSKVFPDASEVSAAKHLSGFEYLIFDSLMHSVKFLKQGIRLDLGGIAKGYVAEAVIRRLEQLGIASALADAGGDLFMSAAPPHSEGWKVGVNIPETTDDLIHNKLSLQQMAVATSGDVYQYIEHDGKKYSHIINPQTGYGVTFQQNVTIIARDGATADWLATACSILPFRQSKKSLKSQC